MLSIKRANSVSVAKTWRIGWKVVVEGRTEAGAGEIVAYPDTNGLIEVAYFSSPVAVSRVRVPVEHARRVKLQSQTRCFFRSEDCWRIGRVLACHDATEDDQHVYFVQFPNEPVVKTMVECDFHARSYLGTADPVQTLSGMFLETPFFFETRSSWVRQYRRHVQLAHGLTGLISSKIEMFPHQVEVARRVLQDPTLRYLLADEVGLGKTIEAGIILRQLKLDMPGTKAVVLAPEQIVVQWQEELEHRFDLGEVEVWPHERILDDRCPRLDTLVIDEAHRIVPDESSKGRPGALFEAAARWSHPSRTRNLLLLSATPVLHHEQQLLSLLHLLDPEAYRLADADAFRSRLAKRRDIGRKLMVLGSARVPLLVDRAARSLAELLPGDDHAAACSALIHDAVQSGAQPAQARKLATALELHVAETYRVHRRMLRTRRRQLSQEGEWREKRTALEPEYECSGGGVRDAGLIPAWESLEDWRIEVAAQMAASIQDPAATDSLAQFYLQLAGTLAWDRRRCAALVKKRLRRSLQSAERERLEALAKRLAALEPNSRYDALIRLLSRESGKRWVVFCGSQEICLEAAVPLRAASGTTRVEVAHAGMDALEFSEVIQRAREHPLCWLVVDGAAEEGVNLQFADALVFLDLPFSPMRLEQRVGRLDRMDRSNSLACAAVLTANAPELAFDAAWYRVLLEGFGLLGSSVSDLQFLIERQLAALTEKAFFGGPSALLRDLPGLQRAVQEERDAAEEQDVIDGLRVADLQDSDVWKDLDEADCEEKELEAAFEQYFRESLKMRVDEDDVPRVRTVTYRKGFNDPLIPLDRLLDVARFLDYPSTFERAVAMRHKQKQFLRPGHPFLDKVHDVADWDERGRAFALWRTTTKVRKLHFLFRLYITTSVERELTAGELENMLPRSLGRLVRGWCPELDFDLILDVGGIEAEPLLQEICRRHYDKSYDKNLGGDCIQVLKKLVNERTWQRLCQQAEKSARNVVTRDRRFVAAKEKALEQANDWFTSLAARLRARSARALDEPAALVRQEEELARLRRLAEEMLVSPKITIDSIGFYVLADQPPPSQ